MRLSAESRRGQTLPLWTLSIAAALAVLFFLTNYTNTLRWGIRAQSAADSAASAGIATDASSFNEETTLEFTAAVEEMRIRYLVQGMMNTVNKSSVCGASCDANYASLRSAYLNALLGYALINIAMLLDFGINDNGLQNSPSSAVALIPANCSTFDCAFSYSSSYNGASETVDVTACKKVPFFSPALLGLGATPTFTALGRSVATLAPISEAFVPGNTNPKNGLPFQPDESPAGANADYLVSFKKLTVNMTWYVAGTTRPSALGPGYACS